MTDTTSGSEAAATLMAIEKQAATDALAAGQAFVAALQAALATIPSAPGYSPLIAQTITSMLSETSAKVATTLPNIVSRYVSPAPTPSTNS